jgi:GTP pyrophosphokinase
MDSTTFRQFLGYLKSLQPHLDEQLITKAYQFADMSHTGQKRYSGEPYLTHPVETAKILAEWGMDTSSIVAGLIHDTVEDGAATTEDLKQEFGPSIAAIVDGVTKISDIRLRGSTEEQFVENLRKMVISMSQDLRVVIVKLADRLHNMRTLQYVPPAKQARIAKETLEIYAPLADRLEMGQAKGELEDLAFPFLYPKDYQWLIEYSAPHYKQTEKIINQARKSILKKLAEQHIKAEVHGRRKRFYSLYKKLLRPEKQKDITKIYDLVALRIIVNIIPQCYITLGIVHKLWKPVPKLSISDYIAQPKPNGYQSLHTKVFLNDHICEIQIRTHEMHQQAEYGLAASFYRSEAKSHGATHTDLKQGKIIADQEKLNWVKKLVDLVHEVKNNQELLKDLKHDVFQDRIFVFTPKGDVIDLPQGATPIDFAYHLHTHLGDNVISAKINGKLVKLDHQLTSGDICELVKSKEPKQPNPDWLEFATTNTARSHIMKHVRGGKH